MSQPSVRPRSQARRTAGRFREDEITLALGGRSGIEALCAAIGTFTPGREEIVPARYVLMGEALGAVGEVRPVFVELNWGFRRNVLEQRRASAVPVLAS